MLFKRLLLQKWFRIQSDPELENKINDRLSFKTFLCIAFSQPAHDHSTFSRFRGRLPKNAMDAINSDSKIRYIVEQYFGISHLHDRANRARFTSRRAASPEGSGSGARSDKISEHPRTALGPLEHSSPASIAVFRLHLFKKTLRKSFGRDGLSFSNLSNQSYSSAF